MTPIPKRSTIRLRNFFKFRKRNFLQLNKCLSSFASAANDIRPYIQIELFGNQIGALLDSGASISCISGKAAADFLEKRIS